ncbi:hypothetical protein E2C01_015218 [Portunus trituberculatus]|uniref:Uncharacterized protein n=1 Tax=Portunus trituberculatus TaxID=210409 RepID=A0A5B7DL85_PORTR|nr:hypothetical protein [Portunus trituberculatus]
MTSVLGTLEVGERGSRSSLMATVLGSMRRDGLRENGRLRVSFVSTTMGVRSSWEEVWCGKMYKLVKGRFGYAVRVVGGTQARWARQKLSGRGEQEATYEQWKEALPDAKFLEELLPSQEDLDSIRASLITYRDKIKDSIPEFSLDPKLWEAGEEGYSQVAQWFKERLDDAIQAAEEDKKSGSSIFSDGEILTLSGGVGAPTPLAKVQRHVAVTAYNTNTNNATPRQHTQ